jgi:L-cysteate sulfo-lyase
VLGVHTGAVADPAAQVGQLLREMGEDAAGLRIRTDQLGEGYSTLTGPARRALLVAARTEGLVLDPIYTARALAGLIAEIADGTIDADSTVVFLASGGLPGLFGHRVDALVQDGTLVHDGTDG